MSNNWFTFKHFTIRQDKTAMKVGTDGVLLGAWANVSDCRKILDIGTGTGLIALMLAQRCDAKVDAIEIVPDAASQATENVIQSPWMGRINVIEDSFQNFSATAAVKYDLIVCNPPFFSDSLKAKTNSRSLARHDDQLNPNDLLAPVADLLNPMGHFCLILPAEKEAGIIVLATERGLFPSEILRVRPIPGKDFKRVLIDFSFSEKEPKQSEMMIETGLRHQYSKEYLDLTRDYYLDKC
jgi:tRNA1Val (adenine37-N6)-methyltransferase